MKGESIEVNENDWGAKARALIGKIETEGNVSEGKRLESSTNLAIAYALLAILDEFKKQSS